MESDDLIGEFNISKVVFLLLLPLLNILLSESLQIEDVSINNYEHNNLFEKQN